MPDKRVTITRGADSVFIKCPDFGEAKYLSGLLGVGFQPEVNEKPKITISGSTIIIQVQLSNLKAVEAWIKKRLSQANYAVE